MTRTDYRGLRGDCMHCSFTCVSGAYTYRLTCASRKAPNVYVPPPVYPILGSSSSNSEHLWCDSFGRVRWSMCLTTRLRDEKVTTHTRVVLRSTVKPARSFFTNLSSVKKFFFPTLAELSTRNTNSALRLTVRRRFSTCRFSSSPRCSTFALLIFLPAFVSVRRSDGITLPPAYRLSPPTNMPE